MTVSRDPNVHFCEQCKEAVYFCQSEDELRERGRRGQCGAIFVPDPPTPGEAISTETLGRIRGGSPKGGETYASKPDSVASEAPEWVPSVIMVALVIMLLVYFLTHWSK